jgi:hypothetical protein
VTGKKAIQREKNMSATEKRIKNLFATILEEQQIEVAQHVRNEFAVTTREGRTEFIVVWAGEGWPEDVRAAINRSSHVSTTDIVFAARRFSPGATQILEAIDASYADESGFARIRIAGLIAIRDGDASRGVDAIDDDAAGVALARPNWSRSALDVAEALLSFELGDRLRVAELREITGWSEPQISRSCQMFEQLGWLQQQGGSRGRSSMRTLADKEGLLAAWSGQVELRRPESIFGHAIARNPIEYLSETLAPALNERSRWAVTGWAANELLTPFLSSVPRLQIYVEESMFNLDLPDALGLHRADHEGLIEFRPATETILTLSRQVRERISVVHPARAYADLRALGGRGEDAASNLRSEMLEVARVPNDSFEIGDPDELEYWSSSCERQFNRRLNEAAQDIRTTYRYGYWTSSYRLLGQRLVPKLPELLETLREAQGHETGWPVWLVPSWDVQPKPIDGNIECWLGSEGTRDPSDADFWIANPRGEMYLLRGYQEDSPQANMEPGTILDITLPIWRTGECLLHAARMGAKLGAQSVEIQMTWTGISGRILSSWASRDRFMQSGRTSAQHAFTSSASCSINEINENLPAIAQHLVEPLFAVFDFFQPPESIYEEEIQKLMARS